MFETIAKDSNAYISINIEQLTSSLTSVSTKQRFILVIFSLERQNEQSRRLASEARAALQSTRSIEK